MSEERIYNDRGRISHVVISATHDKQFFKTEFHSSGNTGVKLPDYYKDEKSILSKPRHQLVKAICNFIVYVQHHMKKRQWIDFKRITITDITKNKKFDVYAHFGNSRSQFFEWVHEQLPQKFRNKVYVCNVEGSDTWFQIWIN